MMNRVKGHAVMVTAAVIAIGATAPAQAAITLDVKITSNGDTLTDSVTGTNPAVGFAGESVGAYDITAFGAQAFQSRDELTAVSIKTDGGGQQNPLTIDVSASGYTNPKGSIAESAITPTAIGDTLGWQSEVDGTTVVNDQDLDERETVSNTVDLGTLSGQFSIDHTATVAQSGSNTTTTYDSTTSVPAPAPIALLGAGLMGLGLMGRRKDT